MILFDIDDKVQNGIDFDGYFGLNGKYSLGKENTELTADLILKDTIINGKKIQIPRYVKNNVNKYGYLDVLNLEQKGILHISKRPFITEYK